MRTFIFGKKQDASFEIEEELARQELALAEWQAARFEEKSIQKRIVNCGQGVYTFRNWQNL